MAPYIHNTNNNYSSISVLSRPSLTAATSQSPKQPSTHPRPLSREGLDPAHLAGLQMSTCVAPAADNCGDLLVPPATRLVRWGESASRIAHGGGGQEREVNTPLDPPPCASVDIP